MSCGSSCRRSRWLSSPSSKNQKLSGSQRRGATEAILFRRRRAASESEFMAAALRQDQNVVLLLASKRQRRLGSVRAGDLLPGNVDPPGTVVPVAATWTYSNVARISASEADRPPGDAKPLTPPTPRNLSQQTNLAPTHEPRRRRPRTESRRTFLSGGQALSLPMSQTSGPDSAQQK